MTEMILLGAGASCEAGVPLAYDMSRKIATEFQNGRDENLKRIIFFVMGGLLFQQGVKGNDPNGGVDVEELFNAVQLLADRRNLEIGPFVGVWHEMVEKLDAVSSSPEIKVRDIADGIDHAFQSYRPYQTNDRFRELLGAFAKRILGAAKAQHGVSGEGRSFARANEEMIRVLKRLVWIVGSDQVKYLYPLLRLLNRQPKLVITSLNYDNSIELLAETYGIECRTGIDQWSSTRNPSFEGKGLYLIKLHGSIDWAQEYEHPKTFTFDPKIRRPKQIPLPKGAMPRYVIRRVNTERFDENYKPAVIFGQRNKLTTEGPFLDLLRIFKEELLASDQLTIVGYSFRDPHVNEYLWQWLTIDAAHQIRIIDPAMNQFSRYRTRNSDPEYGQLLGQDFIEELLGWCNDRVEVISEKASTGIQTAFG